MERKFARWQSVVVRDAPTDPGGMDASGWAGWQGQIVMAHREIWDTSEPLPVYEVRLISPGGAVHYEPITENWLETAPGAHSRDGERPAA